MPKFRMNETIPCFVTWQCVIEADSEEHARQLYADGERGKEESKPLIGDSIPYAVPEKLECWQIDP